MDDGAPEFDYLGQCRPGMVLKTRDRREATILAVDRENRIIVGEVRMMGRCEWRADGRYRRAPAGAAGPWDLVPPAEPPVATSQRHASLAAALQDSDDNPGCCD
ncbi:MAG TPA: hypothetical protein VMT54_09125 [Candidatus Cybelea sp.]|nr:hypothetical protein [Candidatus Cybelea sp.]